MGKQGPFLYLTINKPYKRTYYAICHKLKYTDTPIPLISHCRNLIARKSFIIKHIAVNNS